jgi:hypothetical protein
VEFPDLQRAVHLPYADRGVRVVGLYDGESPDLLLDFVEETGVTFPLVEARGTLRRFAFPPGVGYPYPRDILVGPDLKVRAIRNSFDVGEIEALVDEMAE